MQTYRFAVIGKSEAEQRALYHALHELLGVETVHELHHCGGDAVPAYWVLNADHNDEENNDAALELVTTLIEAAGFHVEVL